MSRIAWLYWLTLPLICGVFGLWIGRDGLEQFYERSIIGSPLLDCSNSVSLGEQECGYTTFAKFKVANRGRKPLIIDEVKTSCACTGLEIDRDGPGQRLSSVTLQSGESLSVRTRVLISGRPGQAFSTSMTIVTNDPFHRQHNIQFVCPKVLGGTNWSPGSLVLGSIPIQSSRTEKIALFNGGIVGRKIARVEPSDPTRFSAKFVACAETHADSDGNAQLGTIEVAPTTRAVGSIDGYVRVYLADEYRAPDEIPVFGSVVAPVEVVPPTIALPRQMKNGVVNEAAVYFRSLAGLPFSVELPDNPEGVMVVLDDHEVSTAPKKLLIGINPGKLGLAPNGVWRIDVRVRAEGQTFELPVKIVAAKLTVE